LRDITEKVSYLQGLSEGLNINDSSPQGKIIAGILGVLDDMADKITTLEGQILENQDHLDEIDDNMFELETSLYGQEDYTEMDCPHCGENLYFKTDLLDGNDTVEIVCPQCNEVVYVNDGSFDYKPDYIDNGQQDEETHQNNSSS